MGVSRFFDTSKRHPLQRSIKPKAGSLFTKNCHEKIKLVGGEGVKDYLIKGLVLQRVMTVVLIV